MKILQEASNEFYDTGCNEFTTDSDGNSSDWNDDYVSTPDWDDDDRNDSYDYGSYDDDSSDS